MNLIPTSPIWIYTEVIDFRKQINGLVDIIVGEMEREANDGAVYVFRNRQSNKVKAIIWDRNGFVMLYKRLEKGRFDFPSNKTGSLEITSVQYEMILSGMPVLHLGIDAEKGVQYS